MTPDQALALISQQRTVTVTKTMLGEAQETLEMPGRDAAACIREYAHDKMRGVIIVQYGLWISSLMMFKIKSGEITL